MSYGNAISKHDSCGFEPTHLALVELGATSLDHSGKLSVEQNEVPIVMYPYHRKTGLEPLVAASGQKNGKHNTNTNTNIYTNTNKIRTGSWEII